MTLTGMPPLRGYRSRVHPATASLVIISAALQLALVGGAAAQPETTVAFDEQFCSEVSQYMNWTNANIDAGNRDGQPMTADPLARLDSVNLDCASRTVSFRHYVDRPDGEALRADWLAGWAHEWCKPGVWREAIEFGWVVADMITFADGARYDITAVCG